MLNYLGNRDCLTLGSEHSHLHLKTSFVIQKHPAAILTAVARWSQRPQPGLWVGPC